MKIILNGGEETLSGPIKIKDFIEEKGWKPDRIAVELNLQIIDRENWTDVMLKEDDRLEILQFVGGGTING